MDLSVSIGSLRLPNPLIAASGCFGYGVEYSDVVDLSTLGGVAVKGLFLAEREGHPPPRIVETPSGMLNAIGLQGIGVHRFVREKLPELRDRRAIVFVNICGTTIDEYVELARILSDAEGVAALELNISCPNIKEGGITFGCSLTGTHRRRQRRPQGHDAAGHPEADAERHRRRVVRARGGRGRRRCRLAREHVPRDGDRRRDAPAEAVEHRRRPERPGDPADCRAHGLRVPAGGEAADHRHGRHQHRRRCARVHDCRRHRRAGRHGQLRRSVHLAHARRRACAPTWTRHGITRLADLTGSLDTTRREQAWISS